MKVQDRIKELRVTSKKTQEDVAKLLDVPRPTYAKWEKDIHPDYSMLQKIADLYHTSVDYLLNGTSADLLPGGKVAIYVENDKLVDVSELPPAVRQQILEFIDFLKTQHLNKK
jgi:transcriptional regulator with XRE-family HTH domain